MKIDKRQCAFSVTSGPKTVEKVAGVDEAGRGCLAGPVMAAAVILPPGFYLPELTDSKKISPTKRERLKVKIQAQALAWAVGLSWPGEIDRINILQASLLAMYRAVSKMKFRPELVLVDGNQKIPIDLRQETIVGGDASEPCISAASIIAKVCRDRLMLALNRRYPGYGLDRHKGYGTQEHRDFILLKGPSPMHRMSFKGVGTMRRRERQKWFPGL
ncbi:MAG: ribonuclease HII [Thermodesulfobacteriota bacterium]